MSTPAQREAFREASRPLAEHLALNATIIRRVSERSWEATSRTRPGLVTHRIDLALDNALLCTCEAGMNNTECWAVKAVREELANMTATETRELVPITVQPPTALMMTDREMNQIKSQAALIFAGRVALPEELNSADKVAAVMMQGWELGLKPMTAIRHLYIVKGKIALSAEVMAGLVIRAFPDARFLVEELTDEKCIMRLVCKTRGLDKTYTVTWQDIVNAGLHTNPANKAYPQDRMRYHATKRLVRIYFPDVINGLDAINAPTFDLADEEEPLALYNPGDVPDGVDGETGEILEGNFREAEPASAEQVRRYNAGVRVAARTWPADEYKAFADKLVRDYPHAFQSVGAANLKALTGDQIEEIIAFLNAASQQGSSVASEPEVTSSPSDASGPAAASQDDHVHGIDHYDQEGHGFCRCGVAVEEQPSLV